MKNKKLVNLMVGTLFLSSLMMGGLYTKDTMATEANVQTLDYSIKELNDIYDGEQEFFIKSYTTVDDKLNEVSKTSDKLENIFLDSLISKEKELNLNNKLDRLLEVTYSKLSIGNKINELFKQDVDLSKQNKDLVADLTILGELNLDTDLSNISNDSQFYKNVNFYIELAKNQKNEQDSAKESLEKVFSSGKVVSTDKKYLDMAKKNINKVKDEEVKKELLKSLEISQKQYEKEEAERLAKEKAEKEAKEKAEREAREKAEREAEEARKKAESSTYQQTQIQQQNQPSSNQVSSSQATSGQQSNTQPVQAPTYKYTVNGYASVTLSNSQYYIDTNRYSWISISDIPTLGGVALLGHSDASGTWVAGSSVGDIVNVSGRNYKIYNKYIVGWNSQEEWDAIEQCISGEMSIITCASSAGDTNWVLRLQVM